MSNRPILRMRKHIRTWTPSIGIMPYGHRRLIYCNKTIRKTHGRYGEAHWIAWRVKNLHRAYQRIRKSRRCHGLATYSKWQRNQEYARKNWWRCT